MSEHPVPDPPRAADTYLKSGTMKDQPDKVVLQVPAQMRESIKLFLDATLKRGEGPRPEMPHHMEIATFFMIAVARLAVPVAEEIKEDRA